MEHAVIDLNDIKKIYHIGGEDFAALAGITLQIEEGEFVALMGPSGSGKSTLMNILGCLDRPSYGSYKLGGKEVAHLSDDELADTRNKRIGFVFQNFNLLSRITALDNVALPLVYAGVGRKERNERAMDKLRSVGLETWADHQPNELSGGQRQRVAIARALVNNPHIIMADEPTGNLDTKSTKEIMKLFEALHEEKKTVILVTHEPEIAACASRQLLLCDGRITRDEGRGVVMDVV
ncbi:MAG: ABC transporter ATP-binding protein [Megasphaera sp.]|jgi:putative ABC transport system ATP-binding protein|nr:ABC transporter ATP-binding protein [Megasphaera sp.]MCH4187166.1 ABC transporter ATP-binding protein [Megasphaera sp.]MCH4217440.1 ABC transporter ATP-binding protein [Megasphaera sp.]